MCVVWHSATPAATAEAAARQGQSTNSFSKRCYSRCLWIQFAYRESCCASFGDFLFLISWDEPWYNWKDFSITYKSYHFGMSFVIRWYVYDEYFDFSACIHQQHLHSRKSRRNLLNVKSSKFYSSNLHLPSSWVIGATFLGCGRRAQSLATHAAVQGEHKKHGSETILLGAIKMWSKTRYASRLRS